MILITKEELKNRFLKLKEENNLTDEEAVNMLLENIAEEYLNTYF